jgi:hypothetical protein
MRILNFENFKDHNLSEGLNYHLNKNIGLLESVYRIESDSWLDLINESRQLWLENKLDLDWDDVFLISTDAGLKSNYKGKEVLLDVPFEIESGVYEAEYKGRKVDLNKPFRTANAPRKFGVYTKNDSGKVVLVRFGQPGMRVRNDDPKRSKSFRARHNCASPGPKWKARYWACNVGRYSKLLGLKSSSPW